MKIDLSNKTFAEKNENNKSTANKQKVYKWKNLKTTSLTKIQTVKKFTKKEKNLKLFGSIPITRFITLVSTTAIFLLMFIFLILITIFSIRKDYQNVLTLSIVLVVINVINFAGIFLDLFLFFPNHDLKIDDSELKTNYLLIRIFGIIKFVCQIFILAFSIAVLVTLSTYHEEIFQTHLPNFNTLFYAFIGLLIFFVFSGFLASMTTFLNSEKCIKGVSK